MVAVPPIGIIAPTVEIAQRAKKAARELGMHDMVDIRVGFHLEGLSIARRFVEEGAEVLISRRSTAALIEESLDIPNVSLPVTLEDLSLALRQARAVTGKAHPQVAVFVMPDVIDDVEAFARHLGFGLHIYPVTPDEEYLSLMVDRAIADKMDVVVAGTVATAFANERNLFSVFMDSGPIAIQMALKQARRVSYARRLEKTRAENFQIVFDSSSRGLLVLDAEQNIVMANPSAHDILYNASIVIGDTLTSIIPELDLAPYLAEKSKVQNLFLQTASGPLALDATPVWVNNTVRSIVVTVQPAQAVTELGASMRNNLWSQGFSSRFSIDSIIGESSSIKAAKTKALGFAASSGSVLLAGETGTGKELFAHAIHEASQYSRGPFVPVNCAALPPSLLESELFGYEDGAFTGAARKGKPGMFELAHQGTIFLDEISELPIEAQLRLLRVLQERSLVRLGGSRLIPLDIRVIAATNKNLPELVERGLFRKDLFYRLNVLTLFIPPLRHRDGDIVLLARHFFHKKHAHTAVKGTLKKQHINQLVQYSWPGNVRELQSVVARYAVAVSLGENPDMRELLQPEAQWNSLDTGRAAGGMGRESNEEKRSILRALEECDGKRGKAAALLGMNRSTLFRKMSRYGIV